MTSPTRDPRGRRWHRGPAAGTGNAPPSRDTNPTPGGNTATPRLPAQRRSPAPPRGNPRRFPGARGGPRTGHCSGTAWPVASPPFPGTHRPPQRAAAAGSKPGPRGRPAAPLPPWPPPHCATRPLQVRSRPGRPRPAGPPRLGHGQPGYAPPPGARKPRPSLGSIGRSGCLAKETPHPSAVSGCLGSHSSGLIGWSEGAAQETGVERERPPSQSETALELLANGRALRPSWRPSGWEPGRCHSDGACGLLGS